ncbi:MAG TPA: hypothetical protein VI670_13490 [Thermoanaerobaculia bacterium]
MLELVMQAVAAMDLAQRPDDRRGDHKISPPAPGRRRAGRRDDGCDTSPHTNANHGNSSENSSIVSVKLRIAFAWRRRWD